VSRGSVNALVPFYAIGVFTGFAMAGYGMSKHNLTRREPGWLGRVAISLSAAILSTVVVGIFAVANFTEGAWLVVVVFPLLVGLLMRLNREYRAETAILENFRNHRPHTVKFARHRVLVMVNGVDLAVLEALRYGRGLRVDTTTAVHFMVDSQHAKQLQKRWEYYELETPLRVVDCPDRRFDRAAQELVTSVLEECTNANVTVLLPRRSYAPLLGRLLHDRTADMISRAVSRIPDAAATIVPYDVQSRIREAFPDLFEERITRSVERMRSRITADDEQLGVETECPEPTQASVPVDGLIVGHRSVVEGCVDEADEEFKHGKVARVAVVSDESGTLRVIFNWGQGEDVTVGQLIRVTGKARRSGNRTIYMTDPSYQILTAPSGDTT
jgi:hypothetical protein